MRGKIIAYVTTHKRKVKHEHVVAISKLRIAYTTFKTHPCPENKDKWQAAKGKFELWAERKEQIYSSHFKSDLFRYGNKLGRMMANLPKGNRRASHITALRDKEGTINSDPERVNHILQEFYGALYSNHPELSLGEKGRRFLQRFNLPLAAEEDRNLLNAAISEQENQDTIKRLGLGKAPGLDGYPGEFYKILTDQISPKLASHFNAILSTRTIRPESKHAFFKVLPKPGRDPLCSGSHRPKNSIQNTGRQTRLLFAPPNSTLAGWLYKGKIGGGKHTKGFDRFGQSSLQPTKFGAACSVGFRRRKGL